MSGLARLFAPETVAIVGLSGDPAKHGSRVLANMRRLSYPGSIWGVNPSLPSVDGVEMFASLRDLPSPPDLVICAVPAPAAVEVARDCAGAGGVVVFAGGFGESGSSGREMQNRLGDALSGTGARLIGPNSGGVIRPSAGLAASFLTCLDRPAGEIRPGPVGLVTQSGGMGSYLHNHAAARGGGLAVSVSTGNEVDVRAGEAIEAVASLDDVEAVLAIVETVRDGERFVAAVRKARAAGKPVVVCAIGQGRRGRALMTSHTGAMALPEPVLRGVLSSLGVVLAETPAEALEIAEVAAASPPVNGDRVGVVTHSGGMAIHLADLAERAGLALPQPGAALQARLGPLLDLGSANNPLDLGGIIGGAARFSSAVEAFADSGEYDVVLAVSTAHPPEHSTERVESLLGLQPGAPVVHLWMAGDQAGDALGILRRAGAPVTEEPRAAVRSLAALTAPAEAPEPTVPISGPLSSWDLPLVDFRLAANPEEAVEAAADVGYPVVVKIVSPGLAHKTEIGGVRPGLSSATEVESAFAEMTAAAVRGGLTVEGVRVEPYRPGLEMIVGGIVDDTFGPLVSVGLGGVHTELLGEVEFAPAPLSPAGARKLIERMRARPVLEGWRSGPRPDVEALAGVVSTVSRGLVGSSLSEIELNPLIWDGTAWVAVDWLAVP